MIVTNDIQTVRDAVRQARRAGQRIGCVPTMGALHDGHMSLVEESKQLAEFTVVTIFVNPTQFAPHEDLAKYPRPLENDLARCRAAGVDCVFTPTVDQLYPAGFQTWVTVEGISQTLEGEFRPGHFRGVSTIVAKLFLIVQPDVACFGSKDYQQLAVIRQMVTDLDFAIEIIGCKTIRDPDGLAMSSRNVYLSSEERTQALAISRSLRSVAEQLQAGTVSIAAAEAQLQATLEASPGVKIQYAVLRDPLTLETPAVDSKSVVGLVAAHVGKTRLIDHLTMTISSS